MTTWLAGRFKLRVNGSNQSVRWPGNKHCITNDRWGPRHVTQTRQLSGLTQKGDPAWSSLYHNITDTSGNRQQTTSLRVALPVSPPFLTTCHLCTWWEALLLSRQYSLVVMGLLGVSRQPLVTALPRDVSLQRQTWGKIHESPRPRGKAQNATRGGLKRGPSGRGRPKQVPAQTHQPNQKHFIDVLFQTHYENFIKQ